MENQVKQFLFKLKKPFSDYKVGESYNCFNGLVRGLVCNKTGDKINFDDKEYFSLDIMPKVPTSFEIAKEVLKDNFKAKERIEHVPMQDDEILVSFKVVRENYIELQFHGYAIVLCSDGKYFIEDTSG